jgi:hypothetical protein
LFGFGFGFRLGFGFRFGFRLGSGFGFGFGFGFRFGFRLGSGFGFWSWLGFPSAELFVRELEWRLACNALPFGHRVLFALELGHGGPHRAQMQVAEVDVRASVTEEGIGPLHELHVLLFRLELHPVPLRFQPALRPLGRPRARVPPRQRVFVCVRLRQRVFVRGSAVVRPRQR